MDEPIPRPVREAGSTILDALLGLAAEREDVRRALTTVNAYLARELTRRAAAASSTGARADGGRADAARTDSARSDSGRVDSGHGMLVPRGARAGEAQRIAEVRPVDLERVRARAAWKAEALRLALARRAAGQAPGPELRQREADLRARQSAAGAPWAWMLDSPPARVEDDSLATLAHAYELVARVAEGVHQLERAEALEPAPPVDLLRIIAEAQSALLVSLSRVGLRHDEDQRDLFQWLRDRTMRHRIYVDRHMRLEDPADPGALPELAQRFEELVERTLALGVGRKHRLQALNKLRYHVRRLAHGGASAPDEWISFGSALVRGRQQGLPPDDKEVADLLAPLAGLDVPADVAALANEAPEAVGALVTALDLARGGEAARADSLAEVRRLLQGRRALMVAETDDAAAKAALVDAFGLEQLDWLAVGPPARGEAGSEARREDGGSDAPAAAESQEGTDGAAGTGGTASSSATESPASAAPRDTADAPDSARLAAVLGALEGATPDLVFMGLRLPQGEYLAFKERCVELKLPFVRLPGPPTPGAVAHQALRQVGWRLRGERSAPEPNRA